MRTSHAKRPFCPSNRIRNLSFFTDLTTEPAAKLWGRLKPKGYFRFLIFVFSLKKLRREREIVRTSQAKRLFSAIKIQIFFIFGHIWERNREDVSSKTSVYETWRSILRPCRSAKLWGRLKQNIRFANLSRTKTSETSKLWGRLSPNARSWKIWSVFFWFFINLCAQQAAKLWGRLRQISHFSLWFFCWKKKRRR